MTEHLTVSLTLIVVLGIAAQWLAWRLRLPSILLLLLLGFIVGPVTGFLHPDEVFGELLFPLVSLSVAIILFEGGLSLKLSELRSVGGVVTKMITLGALVTWAISAAAAHFVLNLTIPASLLLGAILVVTGPTVVGPLLKHVQPAGRVGSVLKWEGILIDPIGATLAVLVYQAIYVHDQQPVASLAFVGFMNTVLAGGLVGLLGAVLMIALLKLHLIPDQLHNAASLALVIGTSTLSNALQTESGLLAVTVLGMALANQRVVAVRHIVEFKESLLALLLGSLFIVLAARLQLSDLTRLNLSSLLFVAILMLVARPLCVFVSTLGSDLSRNEKLFLSWLAPRGIVAAAVSSVFALELAHVGSQSADRLVPITFLVIVSTVAVYGLSASWVARRLGLAKPNPQGFLFAGAHTWARALAAALQSEGYRVLLVDTNHANISAARMEGLDVAYGSILSEQLEEELELEGIGKLMALTSNDEVNSLACLQYRHVFGRANIYQLPTKESKNGRNEAVSSHHQGRIAFPPALTYAYFAERFAEGAIIKKTSLSQEFDYDAYQAHHENKALPLFLITQNGELIVCTDSSTRPKGNCIVISLVTPAAKDEPLSSAQTLDYD